MYSPRHSRQIFCESRINGHIKKILKYKNFLKIRPMGAEFHAGGQRDTPKLIVAFYNFVNAPKNALNY